MQATKKTNTIVQVALALLREDGDYGLTMRRVASNAGMSLSNVQYYFKNKNELLKAMADVYFNQCLDEMKAMDPIGTTNPEQDIHSLLQAFLIHGLEVSEMCRIFREYWAISTRNPAIDDYLKGYYQQTVTIVSELMRPVAHSEACLSRTVSVFVPFVEGYSITALSMPQGIEQVTKDMTTIIMRMLANDY